MFGKEPEVIVAKVPVDELARGAGGGWGDHGAERDDLGSGDEVEVELDDLGEGDDA